jgi:putative sterol carrier protein
VRRVVPYFNDPSEIYTLIGGLFEELAEDAELERQFRAANTTVQYQYRDPEAQITVRTVLDEPVRIDFGYTDMEPQVVMTMQADIAHRFWLGKVNVTVALARGQMHAKGPVAKVLKLMPLLRPAAAIYRRRLLAAGRNDLARVA